MINEPTTTSTLSIAHSSVTSSIPTNAFQTPVFVFPPVNTLMLHLKTALLNLTINCTVTSEGGLSQLTTMWSYNGTMITTSQKYAVTNNHLTITQFTPEDAGAYECTVKHPSGWKESRRYVISIKPGK